MAMPATVIEPPPAVERFVADELTPVLDRFKGSGLLEEGRINLIGLDAIAERLGDKWEMRAEQVYDHVERTLAKHLEGGGYFQRVSATDYLVVQPDLGRFAAQASCLTYLRELHGHFLGGAEPAVLEVMEVASLEGGRVTAQTVDPLHVMTAAKTEPRPETARESLDAEALAFESRWNPFVAADGRTLRVSCVLEPVFELKSFTQIGFRIARRVWSMPSNQPLSAQDLRNLSTADIERVDVATIARGVNRLRSESPGEKQPTLFLPVSYTTLSSARGRSALVACLKDAMLGVEKGVVCEICDIEGVPPGALLAAAALVKPFCVIILGKLRSAPERWLDDLRDVGLHGVAFESGQHPTEHAAFVKWADKAVKRAKRAARSVIIHGLPDPQFVALAGLAGASHASLRTSRDDASI